MQQEIEKKFLVHKDKLPSLEGGTVFAQGYLSVEPHIRFRFIDDKVVLTVKEIKKGDSSRRLEWNFEKIMSADEREQFLDLAPFAPITKKRFRVEYKGYTWEIDKYLGDNEGLITAEVEYTGDFLDVPIPEWVDDARDISDDPKYFNRNLGEKLYKSW